jgi:hypothetical protein
MYRRKAIIDGPPSVEVEDKVRWAETESKLTPSKIPMKLATWKTYDCSLLEVTLERIWFTCHFVDNCPSFFFFLELLFIVTRLHLQDTMCYRAMYSIQEVSYSSLCGQSSI